MNYLSTIFPYDIIEKINILGGFEYKIYKKWNRIFVRLTYTKYLIINILHEYHDYAREIGKLGHKYYDIYDIDTGSKLIKSSVNLHELFSHLIKYSIVYWEKNLYTI